MTEVTLNNFKEVFPHVEKCIRNAKFVTLDTEFSSLNYSEKFNNSLFDTVEERYRKMRLKFEQVIPVQIGISAFSLDRDYNTYSADVFTFYVFPRPFLYVDSFFICQSSSFQFLCTHGFDFNKFVYEGISYVNRTQEEQIRKNLSKNAIHSVVLDRESVLEKMTQQVVEWLPSSKPGDELLLGNLKSYKSDIEMKYLVHKKIKQQYNSILWSFERDGDIFVKKVTKEEFQDLERSNNFENDLFEDILGFTRVFRLIAEEKKILVGHNFLTDLMLMMANFEKPLPVSYKAFKKEVQKVFPVIYDTRTLLFDLEKTIQMDKNRDLGGLPVIYRYFSEGAGRHLAPKSPMILSTVQSESDNFHQAGYDSFCTGYIFIRIAHIFANRMYRIEKHFTNTEMLSAISDFKNNINIIKGCVPFIKLDGKDPVSMRPSKLVVTSKKGPLDVEKVTSLFGSCGYMEILPCTFTRTRALVAVDNFGTAKRLLSQSKRHKQFTISNYSAIKHSPIIRSMLWGTLVTSTILLAWLVHRELRK